MENCIKEILEKMAVHIKQFETTLPVFQNNLKESSDNHLIKMMANDYY